MIPIPWFGFLEPSLTTSLLAVAATGLSLVLWWRLTRRVQTLERRLTREGITTLPDRPEPFDRQALRRSLEELLRLSEQLSPRSRGSDPSRPPSTSGEGVLS